MKQAKTRAPANSVAGIKRHLDKSTASRLQLATCLCCFDLIGGKSAPKAINAELGRKAIAKLGLREGFYCGEWISNKFAPQQKQEKPIRMSRRLRVFMKFEERL